MNRTTFLKALSANDVGATGAHQAGILIPKTNKELLAFLPYLDAGIKNPSVFIDCADESGTVHRFRYIHYNNALHSPKGTRNEYRITCMTAYFQKTGARAGDTLEISKNANETHYRAKLISQDNPSTPSKAKEEDKEGVRIRIRAGWARVH